MSRGLVVVLLLACAAFAEWSFRSERQRLRPFLDSWKEGDFDGKHLEIAKRFRGEEFRELFRRLASESDDWRTRHRALLGLERIGDPRDLDAAAALLDHPQRRLRERAAIACILLWRPGAEAPDLEPERERDPHVRSCLEALERRVAGRLKVAPAEEATTKLENGLAYVPWQEEPAGADPVASAGGGPAPLPADRWMPPLLAYGEEVVADAPLEPFGRVDKGRAHVGLDVGACLDGAGVYAPAAGVVKSVARGGAFGTAVVIEHQLRPGERACSVLMHLGGTLFVEAGDAVECGQLLGTIGLGYSAENGGCLAHLHFGLYAGPFDGARTCAYKKQGDGLGEWHDPADALPAWIACTKPLVADLRPVAAALRGIRSDAQRNNLGRAYSAAQRMQKRADPGSEEHVDATYLVGELGHAPKAALGRARAFRESGYPKDALDELKRSYSLLRAIPGADELRTSFDEWQDDPLFRKALKGDGQARRTDPADREAWRKLLKEYADTCLEPRIRARLR